MTLLLLLLAVGCAPEDTLTAEGDAPASGQGEVGESISLGWPDAEGEDLASLDEAQDASDVFFADGAVHAIAITLSDEARSALRRDPDTYVEGDVTIDGVAVPAVGVRIKGKVGSFRPLGRKPSFKFDFNRYVDGRRFVGLEKLNLNNAITDCSYLHDRVAYRLYGMAGLPTLRTSYASVAVNGDDYGLYVLVEAPDDRYLARNFEDASGNLYDGKYYLSEDWSDYAMVDFDPAGQVWFVLDEGTDVGLADVAAVTEAVTAAAEEGDALGHLAPLVDLDEAMRFWAAEHWIGQADGYVLNRNNYFVYFEPPDNRVQFIPWDLDYSFQEVRLWGFSWRRPTGAMAKACWDDDACQEAWQGQVAALLDAVDDDALVAYAEALALLSIPLAEADPRRECADRELETAREDVMDWLLTRSEDVASFWEL